MKRFEWITFLLFFFYCTYACFLLSNESTVITLHNESIINILSIRYFYESFTIRDFCKHQAMFFLHAIHQYLTRRHPLCELRICRIKLRTPHSTNCFQWYPLLLIRYNLVNPIWLVYFSPGLVYLIYLKV